MKKTLILLILILCGNLFSKNSYKLDAEKELIIIGSGLGSLLISKSSNKNENNLTEKYINSLQKSKINRFDRSATYNFSESSNKLSDYLVYSSIIMPSFLLCNSNIKSDAKNLGVMYLENCLLAMAVTDLIKSRVSRKRPFVYNPEVEISLKKKHIATRSFISGHTTMAFSSATFLSKVYCDYFPRSNKRKVVVGGSLLLASTVGYLRYDAGYHFPTDIIAGAAVGSFIGYIVPEIHKNTSSKSRQMMVNFRFDF